MENNKPEYGKVYALTGATGDKAISNGNTWAESEVKPEPKRVTTAERNRAIKKELVKQYGKNVSLIGGKGTAYGWITIKIELPTPPEHVHEVNQYGRCKPCWELGRKEEADVRAICHKVSKDIGSYVGSYYADDGYDTQHDEILVDIDYK